MNTIKEMMFYFLNYHSLHKELNSNSTDQNARKKKYFLECRNRQLANAVIVTLFQG